MSILGDIGTLIVNNAQYLIGFVMPLLIEVLNKDVQSDAEKRIVALGSCFLAAILIHWNDIAQGAGGNTILYGGLIFTESQVLFRMYFSDSLIRGAMQQVLQKDKTAQVIQ